MNRRVVAFFFAMSGVAFAADASWTSEAEVGVRVNGHSFHHATVTGNGCKVSVRVDFEAPEKGYSDPKNTVRNYHRFRARVRLAKGQFVASKIFSNTSPGEHTFTYDDDTTQAGCWSKDPGKLVKLDVIGCRGKNCDVGSFE